MVVGLWVSSDNISWNPFHVGTDTSELVSSPSLAISKRTKDHMKSSSSINLFGFGCGVVSGKS